ncbi:MAG: mechanosensitive ion channel family protein [Acidobacteriaceae bacterium]|nr:mechanosensitive ion channel family protein [Acidobacteriaceae bacterium]
MIFLTAKLFGSLSWFGPSKFFHQLDEKWLGDLQDFLHTALPKIAITLVVAWIFMRILKLITNRMRRIADGRKGSGAAQLRTLASVTRATGIGIIGFLVLLEVLPLLGFKLEPLLASAGVAGVALGLAAQTIVKDCLNGILILVEDQYNVGDVVKIAGQGGTVEAMSLRKTQVRDGDGTLYIIPNSQITVVANVTRDFSIATINVSVDFSANPDEVMTLLKDVAMGVRNDPAYKKLFLEDPTLLGVDSIKGSQIIYPVQFKTRANQQWGPQREFQRRVRIALGEHHMLPGDPLRVYNTNGGSNGSAPAHLEEVSVSKPDPTSAKPKQVNPFTGEGM